MSTEARLDGNNLSFVLNHIEAPSEQKWLGVCMVAFIPMAASTQLNLNKLSDNFLLKCSFAPS